MIEIDGKEYLTLPEKIGQIGKDIKDLLDSNKKIADGLKPLIEGVLAFISDENVDSLSKVQLCSKIGKSLRKYMEKGE